MRGPVRATALKPSVQATADRGMRLSMLTKHDVVSATLHAFWGWSVTGHQSMCRYEKRHANLSAHISPCFRCSEGDTVVVGQCR